MKKCPECGYSKTVHRKCKVCKKTTHNKDGSYWRFNHYNGAYWTSVSYMCDKCYKEVFSIARSLAKGNYFKEIERKKRDTEFNIEKNDEIYSICQNKKQWRKEIKLLRMQWDKEKGYTE